MQVIYPSPPCHYNFVSINLSVFSKLLSLSVGTVQLKTILDSMDLIFSLDAGQIWKTASISASLLICILLVNFGSNDIN